MDIDINQVVRSIKPQVKERDIIAEIATRVAEKPPRRENREARDARLDNAWDAAEEIWQQERSKLNDDVEVLCEV